MVLVGKKISALITADENSDSKDQNNPPKGDTSLPCHDRAQLCFEMRCIAVLSRPET